MGATLGAEFVGRWRGAVASLRQRSPLPRPSRWMWTADVIVAVVLAACTVAAAHRRSGDVPLPPTVVPLPLPLPLPPPVPGAEATAPFVRADVVRHLAAVQPWQLTLAALTALPLMARRRYPLSAFWAVICASLLFNQRLGGGDATVYTFLSCVIAAYSAAVYSPYRARALVSLPAGAAALALLHDENFPSLSPGLAPFLALLGVGLAANAVHTWKQRVRVLQEEHRAATRLAVHRERARIARELHDVVTHNVSVMVIQAGAARKVMDASPDRARDALLAVEAGGRTAMAELRHAMGLLTMTPEDEPPTLTHEPALTHEQALAGQSALADEPPLAPQPGLGRLTALVDRVRETGVPVELTVTGAPAPLSAGADLAAYRVVQEALTNTVRHAAGARVRIAVDHLPDAVRIEVSDTGGTPAARVAPAPVPGGGRGLTGLRERLAVYGGTLRTTARADGGFQVSAVIPVGVEEPA
ncbi:sensor histidine kinase [Streptomyces sp. NPDC001858]